MQPIDYRNSYIYGRWPFNQVRFWVESRLILIHHATGSEDVYYQCGACKSEDTFAEKDLFYSDNYNFTPVFGPRMGVIFRQKSYPDAHYRSVQPVEKMWEGPDYEICEAASWHPLETARQICDEYRTQALLVAQTEIEVAGSSLTAVIEYPIKTLNINQEKTWYQVDTGPVLFPEPVEKGTPVEEGFALAFAAFNAPHFADFILEKETRQPEAAGGGRVIHYSERQSLQARNLILLIE